MNTTPRRDKKQDKRLIRRSLKGRRIGWWKVGELHHIDQAGHAYWTCTCVCGTVKQVRGNRLLAKRNPVRSCGCYRANSDVRAAARMEVPAKRRHEIAAMGGAARAKKAEGKP
jgi:hypothetical protein